MQLAKRETTVKRPAADAKDAARSILDGAVKRLRRLGKRRTTAESKRAYTDAADLIKSKLLK